jgi:hypothetical protein
MDTKLDTWQTFFESFHFCQKIKALGIKKCDGRMKIIINRILFKIDTV